MEFIGMNKLRKILLNLLIPLLTVVFIPINADATEVTERASGNYYINAMSEQQGKLYNAVKAAVLSQKASIRIDGVTDRNRTDILGRIGDLLLFYDTETWNLSSLDYKASGNSVTLSFSYYLPPEEAAKANIAVEKAAERVITQAEGYGDLAKVRYFHDTILKNCTYTLEAELAGSPYGALVLGEAKCDGYSSALQLLCERSGIPCVTAISVPDGGIYGHAWNKVKIGNSWYNIDCSSDDTALIDKLPKDAVCYDWFMLADSEMGSIHKEWDDPFVTEPIADNTKNDYYEVKKLVAATADEAEALSLTKLSEFSGKSGFITFEMTDKNALTAFLVRYKEKKIINAETVGAAGTASLYVNPERLIVYIFVTVKT
jgi:transglutaminase-like putative cysteine protease